MPSTHAIDIVISTGVTEMELVRSNPDDRAILTVEILKMLGPSTILDDVIVGLIP
jgi:hypothetical protein